MIKLSNTEAEWKKTVVYKKAYIYSSMSGKVLMDISEGSVMYSRTKFVAMRNGKQSLLP